MPTTVISSRVNANKSPNDFLEPKRTRADSPPGDQLTRLTGMSLTSVTSSVRTKSKRPNEVAVTSQFVLRNGLGQKGKLIPLVSNHFPLQVPDQVVYHYDVDIELTRAADDRPSFVASLTSDPCAGLEMSRRGSGERLNYSKRFRKVNYKTNRRVIQELVDTHSKSEGEAFFGILPVYDGVKNIYATSLLKGIESFSEKSLRLFVSIEEEEGCGRLSMYAVNIKFVGRIDLNTVNLYYKRVIPQVPGETIQALDIILRHGPNSRRIPMGNSLFLSSADSRRMNIGGGRQLAFGFYQSVRSSMNGSVLVVDRSSTAFYADGAVLGFVAQLLSGSSGAAGGRQQSDKQRLLSMPMLRDYDRKRIEKELKTLQIQVNHLPYKRKFRVLGLTLKPARDVMFTHNKEGKSKGMVSVSDYFRSEYNRTLAYANMPCIIVGNNQRKQFLPMEVCDLVPDQLVHRKLTNEQTAQMIRSTTSQNPSQRFDVIRDSVRSVISDSRPFLQEFGIKVNSQPLVVDGRVLEPPQLAYQGSNVRPRDGVWNMDKKRLFQANHLFNWVLVNFAPFCSDAEAERLAAGLKAQGKEMGITIADPLKVARVQSYKPGMVGSIFEKARSCVTSPGGKLQLILFIVTGEENLYNEIKLSGDVEEGIPTQCITDRNVKRLSASLLSNILLKINTKLGGTNTVIASNAEKPPILWKRVMVIGADVTHPTDKSSSSIAGCVGSFDSDCTQYYASVRVQIKSKQEVIQDLDIMVVELLHNYQKQNENRLPDHIVIYRDGVSEGQFEHVLVGELDRLRYAFGTVQPDYCPKVTLIVVQKRHHTRFMPGEERDGVGKFKNIPPGTVVDTDCVHPTDMDFFLCSHFGLQGTSRPTHYYVLWDDYKFSADELQRLTFYLCHIYVRCTRSISIPAPVAYAHLAAYRSRVHIYGVFGSESSFSASSSRNGQESAEERKERDLVIQEMNRSIRIQKSMKDAMYFC